MSNQPENELEDFEAFLEPDFEATKFANELLLATNGEDAEELDIVTPMKKLKFDIEECDRRMTKISSTNYESLVGNLSQIEKVRSNMKDINIDRVVKSFDRINTEIIVPFDESVEINQASKKMHQTLDLLRGSSYFIVLIQQLKQLEKGENVVKLARLHNQLYQLYNDDESAQLMSIKLVRNFQPIQITKRNKLINECIDVITNEINHHTTFHEDNEKLLNHLTALSLLSSDFFSILEKATVTRQIQTATSQLQRSLQSPRNFSTVISEIKENNSTYFKTLSNLLKKCDLKDSSLQKLDITQHNEGELKKVFWGKVATKFKQNLAATMARGGPTANNLKSFYEEMRKVIESTFEEEFEREKLTDALQIIKIMNK